MNNFFTEKLKFFVVIHYGLVNVLISFKDNNFLPRYRCVCYSVFKVQVQEKNLLLVFTRPSGDDENRTRDPLLARQVLSQLSYAPILYI